MEEQWAQIKEFPNYSISSEGRVRNDDRGRIVKVSRTQQGASKVGLVHSKKQHTRAVNVLVAEAFVSGYSDIFNTPMHLDGDASNNRAENLVWRPRWFAWKYTRQFETVNEYNGLGPIKERSSGIVYIDIVSAGVLNGILFEEIAMSLSTKEATWPTWQIYDWVKSS